MGHVRPTDTETAAQIGASIALDAADMSRGDEQTYSYWLGVASAANDRTRLMMMDRGVDMLTRARRGEM